MPTSINQAGVAEPRLKIWDKIQDTNLGYKFGTKIWAKNLGQTDGQTDRVVFKVALQLKIREEGYLTVHIKIIKSSHEFIWKGVVVF